MIFEIWDITFFLLRIEYNTHAHTLDVNEYRTHYFLLRIGESTLSTINQQQHI